jgi:hypothetical protein
MDKDTRANIYAEINSSTIPEMLKALYMMASATETLSQHSFQRIRAVFMRNGIVPKGNDLLSGINNYCKYVKLASTQFFSSVEPQIRGATFDALYDAKNGQKTIGSAVAAYDGFDSDALELIRLVLLYIDRTAKNDENYAKVFKTLRMLPSSGLFTDSDIARFKQK